MVTSSFGVSVSAKSLDCIFVPISNPAGKKYIGGIGGGDGIRGGGIMGGGDGISGDGSMGGGEEFGGVDELGGCGKLESEGLEVLGVVGVRAEGLELGSSIEAREKESIEF